MLSTDRQHQLVYSISLLKQLTLITTEKDLSLATRFMLSSLEPIRCMPFFREWVPKSIPYSIKLLKRSSGIPFRKKIKELLPSSLQSEG